MGQLLDVTELSAELIAALICGSNTPRIATTRIAVVGLNYLDHVRETGLALPSEPLLFTKFPTSVIGDGDTIVIDPTLTERVDWEVELAAVIGTTARHVPREDAFDVIAGYTVANDVSARDLQFRDGQWVRGKSLDTFCPLGPAVVSPDEVDDPQALALRTWVNDELVQNSSTAEMIFRIDELIAFCSRSFTLEPGDVILTGTPSGVGYRRDPRVRLNDGDRIVTEIERVGRLESPVVAEG